MPDDRDKTAPSAGRLSTDESAELAGQVAALTRSGLPLAPGLRALADEVASTRLTRALREMADRLQAGEPFDQVVQSQGGLFPQHVRGILLAGIRSGQLAEVMEEFVDLHNDRRELNRRVWLSISYPVLLMSIMTALFIFVDQYIAGEFAEIFRDFEVELPAMTQVFVEASWFAAMLLGSGTVLVVVAALLLTRSSLGSPAAVQLLHAVPLIGPLWRWSRLLQFARLMRILIAQGTPVPQALRLTAAGVRDEYLAAACREAADDVEAGMTLSESMKSYRQFPATMIPMIAWGQRTSALPDAFQASAEVFEGNVQTHGALMETVMTPIAFLIVIGFVSMFVLSMFLPLITLIESLSSL